MHKRSSQSGGEVILFSLISWAIVDYINPYYCGQADYCPFKDKRLRGKIASALLAPLLVLLAPLVLLELLLLTLYGCIVQLRSKVWVVALVLFCSPVFAPKAHGELVDLWIIAKIESNFNNLAYNKASGALGMFQIVDVCLKDYNACHKAKISKNDLKNALMSKRVANWYLNKRIPQLIKQKGARDTIKNRLIAYNAGHCYVNKKHIPKETRLYIKKYYSYLKEVQVDSARDKGNTLAGKVSSNKI